MTIKENQGNAKIVCELVNHKAELTQLSFAYPVRLMQPKSFLDNHQAVYILGYGGGLLAGDHVSIEVQVKESTLLSIHSQASTKVYKRTKDGQYSSQNMTVDVEANAFLCLLPEPVTCFSNAAYKQSQVFNLHRDSSLLLLDWFTPGRVSRGEIYDFDYYYSENIIYIDGKRFAREAYMLKDEDEFPLKERMGKYECFANVYMYGRRLDDLITETQTKCTSGVIHRKSTAEPIMWSVSPLRFDTENGLVLRACAVDTITMREFLQDRFESIEKEIGNFDQKKIIIQVALTGVLFVVGMITTFTGLAKYGQKFKYLTSSKYVLFRESVGYLLSMNLINLLVMLPILVFQATSAVFAFVSLDSTNPEIFHTINFVQLLIISLRGVVHFLYTYFGFVRRYTTKDGNLEISSPVVDYRTSRILSPVHTAFEKPTPFMDPALRRPSLPR
ncbi:hypothetical protein HDV06_006691 [Boothiomyces sp. JEL0866]|nr:hypothetical protein HDV06_006691 [Boothiomyces sp. JEL0866]